MISLGEAAFPLRNVFFRRDALKEQFGKEPSTVRCLAVRSALLDLGFLLGCSSKNDDYALLVPVLISRKRPAVRRWA